MYLLLVGQKYYSRKRIITRGNAISLAEMIYYSQDRNITRGKELLLMGIYLLLAGTIYYSRERNIGSIWHQRASVGLPYSLHIPKLQFLTHIITLHLIKYLVGTYFYFMGQPKINLYRHLTHNLHTWRQNSLWSLHILKRCLYWSTGFSLYIVFRANGLGLSVCWLLWARKKAFHWQANLTWIFVRKHKKCSHFLPNL